MHYARSSGNDSCPAVHNYHVEYALGNLDHDICYGPYATGELGANVSYVLGLSCSMNSTDLAPVVVVTDDTVYGPPANDCWFVCNATYYDQRKPDYGESFFDLQTCIMMRSEYVNGSKNPYGIQCYPKSSGSGAVRSDRASTLAFGLLSVLIFTMLTN